MLKNNIIVFAFNAKLSDGCDYATQTMRIVGRDNVVYALLLGEPLTWRDVVSRVAVASWVRHEYNSTLIRPFFIIPGQRFVWIKQLNYFLNALVLRCALVVGHPAKKKLLWFFEPWNMVSVFWACWGCGSLYDCVDYYRDLGSEWRVAEDYLVPRVTYMTCHSKSLADQHKKMRTNVYVVPLGFAENVFFRFVDIRKNIGKKMIRVGYVGGLNYRLDYQLLREVIAKCSDVEFMFVGPIQVGLIPEERETEANIQSLLSSPNVQYLGEVPKKQLVKIVKRFDVGIIPYDVQYRFNRYSFPMKVMEYFWFGMDVLSTDLMTVRSLEPLVAVYNTADGWIRFITKIQKMPRNIVRAQRRKQIAMDNTWEKKIAAISGLFFDGVK